jgi:acyl-CoA synthetase (AMP-forming)/AMP-acid ligase II/acyl carrier protein
MTTNGSVSSLVDTLAERAESVPSRILYRIPDSNALELTFAQVFERARRIATTLQSRGVQGQRVLLLCEPGLDYVMGFLGVACAGALPVPMFPPEPRRLEASLPRALSIARDCQPVLALTSDELFEPLRSVTHASAELGSVPMLTVNSLDADDGAAWQRPRAAPGDTAFLQYTSGSTRLPRGVMVTHENLHANALAIAKASSFGSHPVGVSWLPPYHDMGLIGTILQAVYSGMTLTLLSPQAFLRRPLRWLKIISEQRANYSGGPNFAYELCARRASSESLEGLDLSSWTLAFSGAEPVHPKTLQRFIEVFASCGFRPDALAPSYGLAEATLLVTGHVWGRSIASVDKASLETGVVRSSTGAGSTQLVSCGRTWGSCQVRVVSPTTLEDCDSGTAGEIWINGANVGAGYWNAPQESDAVFRARTARGDGPFLRTGDLGVLLNDELFVLGRLKDLIIVNGRNHYPQDLEYTVERAHSAIRQAGAAVFSVPYEQGEVPVVVCEVSANKAEDLRSVIDAIQTALRAEHDLTAHDVRLIALRGLPKTSSGKVQRSKCRQAYLQGTLPLHEHEHERGQRSAPSLPGESNHDASGIERWLLSQVASATGMAQDEVDPQRPFASFGIDSVKAVGIATSVEQQFGVELGATALWDFPSARLLAKHLAQLTSARPLS